MRRVSSKDKIPNGLLRSAVASGIAVGLATASLGGIGTANGTCVGTCGINIGDECDSTFGNFALVLGTGTATANTGLFNAASAAGTNVNAVAGLEGRALISPTSPSTSAARTKNSARALLSQVMVSSTSRPIFLATPTPKSPPPYDAPFGIANAAINVSGNRNDVSAVGTLPNLAFNLGNEFTFPNGSDSRITAGTPSQPAILSLAFNVQGLLTEECLTANCPNNVDAIGGPGSIAGAIGVANRFFTAGPGLDINIATPINDVGSTTNVFAAGNMVRPTTFAIGTVKRPGSRLSGSLTKAGKQFSSSLNQISKRLNDSVQNALSGFGKKKQNSEPETGGDS